MYIHNKSKSHISYLLYLYTITLFLTERKYYDIPSYRYFPLWLCKFCLSLVSDSAALDPEGRKKKKFNEILKGLLNLQFITQHAKRRANWSK
jgi:hypothetical protein